MVESVTGEWWTYLLIALAVAALLHFVLGSSYKTSTPSPQPSQEKEERDPPRNFSPSQLRQYDGNDDPKKFDSKAGKIYIAIKGEVFDVSSAADFYGGDGPYALFAGRDASKCLAKMSFDEEDLANPDITSLSSFELDQLEEWIQKFKYIKEYPVVGRLVEPEPRKPMTANEIANFTGTQPTPENRCDPPLYVGLNKKVFDVSYGGFDMYKAGATYHLFAGKDVSRALAKMSFKDEDVNSRDVSDLDEKEQKVLEDWADKFENKKLYPVVGDLVD